MNSKKRVKSVSLGTDILMNAFCAVLAVLCILPLLLILIVSFTDESALAANGYSFFPTLFSAESYGFLFKDFSVVARAYAITVGVTVVGTFVNIAINAMYAYVISRSDFPYRRFFGVAVLITMLFSGGMVPFYYVYVNFLHVKDSLLALLLPGLSLGFNVFIMKTYFTTNLPFEVVESAKIDGAGEIRTFFKIVLPMCLPILATVGLFTAIYYWNDFFNSMLFIEKEKLFNLQYTMQRSLMNLEFLKRNLALVGGASHNFTAALMQIPSEGVRMAMVIVGIGPVILVYPFFQKYFIRGLTVGSVKG